MSQTRAHFLEGGKREERVGELRNIARHRRTHRLEGRKREEWTGDLGNTAHHKRRLADWRGGRGRSRLVSLEMRHITNEDSLAGGEEEGGAGWRAWKRGTSQTK